MTIWYTTTSNDLLYIGNPSRNKSCYCDTDGMTECGCIVSQADVVAAIVHDADRMASLRYKYQQLREGQKDG